MTIDVILLLGGSLLIYAGITGRGLKGLLTHSFTPLKEPGGGAGSATSTTGPPGAPVVGAGGLGGAVGHAVATAGYANPFARVKNLSKARIDEGVDYSGSGPVTAIGDGVVTYARTGTGWPGTQRAFIAYRLTGGIFKGYLVYISENITPTVKVGDQVRAGQTVIGNMTGGIETGFADPNPANDLAYAKTIGGGYSEGWITAAGIAFAHLLASLGVPTVPIPASGHGHFP